MSDLHAHLRRRRLAVFVDLKLLAKALRARSPLAMARRQAEYVLIDAQRVPLGFDTTWFLERHLARVQHTRDGFGYTSAAPGRPTPRVPPHAPAHPSPFLMGDGHVPLEARLALRRQAHAAHGAEVAL